MIEDEARRLRVQERLPIREIQERLGVSKVALQQWLRGVPAPAGAGDDRRASALGLRRAGWSVNDIALEVGVARSTAWLWVRHVPLDPDSERARLKAAKAKELEAGRWEAHRRAVEARREELAAAGADQVAGLSARELFLLGVAIYWCEGSKRKPWRPDATSITFTNSDPGLVELFLRFLETVNVPRGHLRYRVSIHESADATQASRWWAERLSLPFDRFLRPTLKRHNPVSNRRNTGDDYRGCLVVRVPKSRELYWIVEGAMAALAESAELS